MKSSNLASRLKENKTKEITSRLRDDWNNYISLFYSRHSLGHIAEQSALLAYTVKLLFILKIELYIKYFCKSCL